MALKTDSVLKFQKIDWVRFMIKSRIRTVVAAAALVCVAAPATSATDVIGQVSANPSAKMTAESGVQHIGRTSSPYVQGDLLTTTDSTASITLTSGKASFEAAPNTSISILNSETGSVAIDSGAVKFNAIAGFPVVFTSAAGNYTVSSETDLSAIAVVEGESFSLAATSGSLIVESEQTGALTKIDSGSAYSFDGVVARPLDVQTLKSASWWAGLSTAAKAGFVLIGTVGAYVIVDEITDDDDDDDNASPSG